MKHLLVALFIMIAVPAFANVGTIVDTEGSAKIITDGKIRNASVNAVLEEGDLLRTSKTGLIHVVLLDGTKMVVGPDTELSIDIATPTAGKKFKALHVNLREGVMRFISGNSKKAAYNITTPTGTMEVKGTSFDLVASRRETKSVVFSGQLRLCSERNTRPGRCKVQKSGCMVAATGRREIVARRNQVNEFSEFQLLLGKFKVREEFEGESSSCASRLASVRDGRIPRLGVLPGNDNGGPNATPTEPQDPTTPTTPTDPQEPTEKVKKGNGNSSNTNGKSGDSKGQGSSTSPTNQGKGKGRVQT